MDAVIAPHTAQVLLQWLQALTAISSAALLLILPLRALLRRLGGPALAYAAWALLPLALVAAALPHPAQLRVPVAFAPAQGALVLEAGPPLTAVDTPPLPGDGGWLALWLAGSLLMLAFMVWQQWRLQRGLGRLRATARPGVYEAPHSNAGPLVLGLLRPRIVLPADFAQRYSAQEQALVLAHEQAHLRRADLAANALACAAQALWWFNPLVHWAAARLRLDQELACDHAVLRSHPGQRQAYAQAILKTQLAGQSALSLSPLACHWQPHHPLKERIMQLTRPLPGRAQRRAVHALLLAGALATGLGAWAAVADLDTAAMPAPAAVASPLPLTTMAATTPATMPPTTAAPAAPPHVSAVQAAPAMPAPPAATPPAAERAKAAAPAKPAPVLVAAVAPAIAATPGSAPAAAAAQPTVADAPSTPAQASASTSTAAAPAFYALSITHRTETRNADGVLLASQTMRLDPMRVKPGGTMGMVSGGQAHNCSIGLRTNPAPDNMAELLMNLKCEDDAKAITPRVRTRLGTPATVEFSTAGLGGQGEQVVHKFSLRVDAADS